MCNLKMVTWASHIEEVSGFFVLVGMSSGSPLQTPLIRHAGLADFGPSSASSPLSKGNNICGTSKTLNLTGSLAQEAPIRKQYKGAQTSGGR